MGAYENPITVIDTESAKMWQQATANIAQISINAMNAVSARKTKEAKEQEAEATDRTAMAMENQEAVIDRITKSGIKSDAYFQYGMALMDDVTKLEGDLKYYTGDKDQKSLMMKDLAIKKKSISQLVTQGGEVQDYIQEYRERRETQQLNRIQAQITGQQQPQTHPTCLLYTSPSPRDRTRSRMPSSA